jgi:hypothetical protein
MRLAQAAMDGRMRRCMEQARRAPQASHAPPQTLHAGLPLHREALRHDRDLVLRAVRENGLALAHAKAFAGDRTVALAAVQENSGALEFVAAELRADREVVRAALQRGSRNVFHLISERLWSDQTFVLDVLREECHAVVMHWVDAALKRDAAFVLAALRYDVDVLMFVDDLVQDRAFMRQAVERNGLALGYALDQDKDLIMAAVAQDGLALRHALLQDRDVVLAAVRQNGEALRWASDDLACDHDVVLAAMKDCELALYHAHPSLQGDLTFVLSAVHLATGLALPWASRCHDRAVVLAAVTSNGLALRWASRRLQRDREVVLAAVRQNGDAVQWARCRDREVLLAAVETCWRAAQYMSLDDEIVSLLLRQWPRFTPLKTLKTLMEQTSEPEPTTSSLQLRCTSGACLILQDFVERPVRYLKEEAASRLGVPARKLRLFADLQVLHDDAVPYPMLCQELLSRGRRLPSLLLLTP